ncbi:hypothetical protein [Erwinia sp. E_sp_W01_6]|uniref:hypothetical protein n=1 Tax=Erwinia sp. E_sp_W01_6 TaxID=3039408 RepID=UPI0030CEBDBF
MQQSIFGLGNDGRLRRRAEQLFKARQLSLHRGAGGGAAGSDESKDAGCETAPGCAVSGELCT